MRNGIDVGGTTTDVGQLKNGFPREANSVVQVGGVRTLFRMPDLLSIGLGGGSHVQLDPLKVGIAGGTMSGRMHIDGNHDPAVAEARLDARSLEFIRSCQQSVVGRQELLALDLELRRLVLECLLLCFEHGGLFLELSVRRFNLMRSLL